MLKVDHRKTLKHLYHPSGKAPVMVEVPPMNFLKVDGRGNRTETVPASRRRPLPDGVHPQVEGAPGKHCSN